MSELVGLKFPFEVNAKGGLSLVKQERNDPSIFDGKLEQLLNTNKGERVMENDVFADLDTFVFEPNDQSTKTLLEYQIKQAVLKHIPEITLVSVNVYSEEKSIIAYIMYTIDAYDVTQGVAVKVGDMS